MTLLAIGWARNHINILKVKTYSLLILLSLIFIPQLKAQDAYAVGSGEILIDGYDPVAYFDSEVKKGSESFSLEISGRKLLFSSAENKERYQDNPDKYTPSYGGWCAIAMVDGTFVVPDYTLYKIQDGELLFFSVRAFFNGLTQWNKDADKNKVLADGQYTDYFVK